MSNSAEEKHVSLTYLFSVFLKIGLVSFGGFMALIAVVQRQLVEKDQKVSETTLLDGMSLASILPGPMAVNTIGYVGYQLRGFWGAMASMTAVILPCFVLMLGLSIAYFNFENTLLIQDVIASLMPAIVVIISSVAVRMGKKHLTSKWQYAVGLITCIVMQFVGGFWVTILVLIVSGGIGYAFYGKIDQPQRNWGFQFPTAILKGSGVIALLLLSFFGLQFLLGGINATLINAQLLAVFSSMSLTLFGGGYVIIPLIQETIVASLQWLNSEEFNTAIAFSQITPGPILISAAFIGFKLAGVPGAAIATFGIFFPSGLLTIACSHYLIQLQNNQTLAAIFKGLRPAIVGLIFSAAITIGIASVTNMVSTVAFLVLLALDLRFRLSPIWLLLGAAFIGYLGHLL